MRDLAAIAFGVVVSTVLAGTLVIAGLKAGITPGVSPLVILIGWGVFVRAIKPGTSTRFLNLAQVAGSAGMAICSGVIFTAPLLQILYADRNAAEVGPLVARMAELREELVAPAQDAPPPGGPARRPADAVQRELDAARARYAELVPPVDVKTLMLVSLAGALIGFGFVGLGARKFLSDPTLPAPEAHACETMIKTAGAERARRPALGRSLALGLVLSFAAPLLTLYGLAKEHVVLLRRQTDDRVFQLDLYFNPIYIGIGGLLTLATALLVFGGSLLRVIGDFLLAGMPAGSDAAASFPPDSMRWVGGAAMTVAVVYSLIKFFGPRAAAAQDVGDARLITVDRGPRTAMIASIAAGVALLFGWIVMRDGLSAFAVTMGLTVLVMCTLMVALGALLSLQIGSSASPVSGTIFVTTLVLCVAALLVGRHAIEDVLLLSPLLVGACVAVCAANDSSQDYKTLQLCGVRVQQGFLAQFLGLMGGVVVVPLALYVAHEAYTLGSPALPAPQGRMFATLVDGLLLQDRLPWSPILVGLVLGLFAVGTEVLGSRRGLHLPAMALAVGIYLPAYLGIGILVGALFRWAGERGRARQRNESILAAAGLITGAAALELLIGIRILAQKGFSPTQLAPAEPYPGVLTNAVAVVGILALGLLLYANSRPSADQGTR